MTSEDIDSKESMMGAQRALDIGARRQRPDSPLDSFLRHALVTCLHHMSVTFEHARMSKNDGPPLEGFKLCLNSTLD